MTESGVVPAGWYPDPTGRHQHRYWQGVTWTDLVSDAGTTSHDPPPTGPESGPSIGPLAAPPSPGRRRSWWILPVALLGVLALLAGAGVWVVLNRPGSRPVGLAASTVTSRSITLAWLRPKSGRTPERYVVRRNGVEVDRTAGDTRYIDAGLSPLTDYRYQVLALVGGKLSYPTAELVVQTLPEPPSDLASSQVTTTSVVVHWSAPSGPRPDQYIVRRDGDDLATVSADTLSYKDTSIPPKTSAAYAVVAVTRGHRSDETATLWVTTPEPPLADARLQHSWDVTLRVIKSTRSKAKVGLKDTGNWTFIPKCATGACAVEVSGDLAGRPFSMTLNRSRTGALYTGSGRARIARCSTKSISNTLALTVRVTAGDISESTWAVSGWTGNLTLSIPYTTSGNYYCPAQSLTFAVSPDNVTADPTT